MPKTSDRRISRRTLSAPELAQILGISRSGAFNLMHAVGFPSFRVGGRIFVTEEALERWILVQEKKGV